MKESVSIKIQNSSDDISVIIPTYNRLAFLKEALDSVLNQTLAPKEIIIVDDGSTDGTSEWLRTLTPSPLPLGRGEGVRGNDQKTPKIIFFRQSQKGPAAARNLGVHYGTGRWVAFLDSDDLWREKKLETQRNYFETHPECRICQTEEVWIRNGVRVNSRSIHRKYSGEIFEKCLPLCIISPSAVMMERKFFLELGGFDENFPVCEDYELWLRASLQSPVMTLPEALTVKRGGHDDQLSKKLWGMDRFRVQAMEKILRTKALSEAQTAALLKELENKLTILSQGFSKRHPNQTNPYLDKLNELKRNYEIDLGNPQRRQAAGNSGAA